jgi:thiol:disulfide interchange protein DsbA
MRNPINFIAVTLFAVVSFSLFISPLSNAAKFTEGTHYSELATPINDSFQSKREVREFFSFYCPGCYRHEPIVGALKAKLPNGVTLEKNHINGMPGRELVIEQGLSKALLTAKLLNIEEKVTADIFKYIHVTKATFAHDKEIKDIFLLQGIDGQRFDKVFNSFSVKTGVSKMNKSTETLRSQGITSVPTVIVNGRYKVETGQLKSQQEYIDLILFLLALT